MRGVLLFAAIAGALLLGCSSAGRVPARALRQAQQTFDLMPVPPARDPARREEADAVDAVGPLRTSPDGQWIAFESDRGGVHGVWVARRDGQQGRRVSGLRTALSPTWSPNGVALAFIARDGKRSDTWAIWMVHPAEGDARKMAAAGTTPPTGASWFPDSRRICFASDSWLIVLDTQNGATRAFRLPNDAGRVVGTPAVAPDGRRFVFAVAGDGAWMVSLPNGAITQIVSDTDVDGFAWAPGGRQIAFRSARDGRWKVQTLK